ncbi:ribonuclease H-like domain-containing protein [Tanacetum coccineum]
MSQPANDDFSQHLSDDEASYHEDALENDGGNGNSKKRISTGKDGVVRILPSISAAEIHAVKKERKARTILLMAIPKEHLRRFHGIDDAKEIWEDIRTRFGGNANSKKMQKAVLKQQFEAFTISSSEELEKGYDRSFPPAWSNLAMTMRTKPDVDTLSIDDLYNNLRVFEQELTSTSKSSASAQNVAFVLHSKSNNNKVKSGHTEDLDLLHEDLEQINDVDIEEMDINWQIAMIVIRMKKFYKKTGRRGEHIVEEEETNHALMAISSNNKVSLCSKTCIDSYNKLKTLCDEQTNQLGMTSNSKVGLGYEIQSNNEVLSYEEEMNRTVFKCTEEDFLNKPLYSRFSKTDNFKGVPHPLTRDYIPKLQEEIDDSLYVYGKKGPQKPETSVSNDKFSENSVTSSEEVVSEPKPKEAEPSCVTHVKTPRQPMKNQGTPKVKGKNWNEMMERELGEGYSFIKKKCFVSGSLSHLIRDYDFYEKKMAKEAELKKQRVFNTGNGVAKLVWNNANRVNRANHFIPRPVQLNTVRQNVNSVRPNVNTGRSKQPVPTSNSNSFSHVRPQVNKFKQRSHFSKSHSPVRRPIVRNTARMTYSHAVKGNWGTTVKISACYNWRRTRPNSNYNSGSNFIQTDHPLKNMEDRGIFDSGCSGHMTGNKDHLDDFEECKGGSVTFGGSKGYITGKGRIRVGNLDFDSVSFVKELGHFNLFSISQICDKQHKVLFTETECLVVSPDFKMPDENQILLKVPRQHNMYSFDMKTPSLTKNYACLIAKSTSNESKLWHRRFSWVFFLATKDETSGILQNFIRQIKNQLNHRVKIIRSDNHTEFKNRDMLEFCGNKGIKQEYSNARTPQQNGVAERMNRTLIEAARTMLADSLLPTTFWAEAVSTACYIFNRVRVTKPQNKTPYELLFGHKLIISYIRPFGCHVTILDTLSVLGNFDGKCDEGFLVGYSLNSKAFRVYNLVTKKVEVNLHVKFLEEKPNVKGVGYRWMFDIDYLTDSMNYIPVSLENQTNPHAGTSEVTNIASTLQTPNANASEEEDEAEELIIVPPTVRQVGPRKSSTNSKAEEFFIELQNLKTQERGLFYWHFRRYS